MRWPSMNNERWILILLKEEKEIISTLNKSNDEVRIDNRRLVYANNSIASEKVHML